MRLIKYKGQEDTVLGWALKLKVAPATLAGRLDRGWSVERAFNEKPHDSFSAARRKGRTKNDAEMYLNDLSRDEMPLCFRHINLGTAKLTKFGQYIRRKHMPEFEKWFSGEFSKMSYGPLK